MKITNKIQNYITKLDSDANLSGAEIREVCELVREGIGIIDRIELGDQPVFSYFTEADLSDVLGLWRNGMLIYSILLDHITIMPDSDYKIEALSYVRGNLEALSELNYKVRGFRIKAVREDAGYNETLPKIDNLFKNNVRRTKRL